MSACEATLEEEKEEEGGGGKDELDWILMAAESGGDQRRTPRRLPCHLSSCYTRAVYDLARLYKSHLTTRCALPDRGPIG